MLARSLALSTFLLSFASSAFAQAGAPQVPTPASDVPRPPAQPALGTDGPPLERVTFDAAVARALARNPTALEAAEEIRRYHALMEEVRASSLPTLYGFATYTHLDSPRITPGGPVPPESNVNVVALPQNALNANLTLNAPLINPRGWVQWGQAHDQVDVARANAADIRRTLAVATARAYLSIIAQRRLLETAIIARDNAKGHYGFTRAQLLGGVGNRLDEVRAAQELTTDEVLLQNQEVALFRAREALGVLVAGDGSMDVAEATFGRRPTLNDALNEAQKIRRRRA